jgi:D-apionolactonase
MNFISEYTSSLSKEIKWHGNHNENVLHKVLKAGCLSMIFENGNIRHISFGNTEIIRMIYSAVRDKQWITITPFISGVDIVIREDSFLVEFNCHFKSAKIDFLANYRIEGINDNSVIFSFEGEALNSFEKNRIGFCVLHPIEGTAGKNCEIIHTNGESESLTFPVTISPHQSFSDINSIKWKISDSFCTLRFYGDIFETEDQRNWTDASYKTYCTPLSRPFPVKLEKGSKIVQRIEFSVEAKAEAEVDKGDGSEVLMSVQPEKMTGQPSIGIGQTTRQLSITDSEIEIIRELRFNHYRVDIYLFNPDWKRRAELAVLESEKLGYHLELALFIDNNFEKQLSQFINWSENKKTDMLLISIFHKTYTVTPDSIINTIYGLLKNAFPGVKVGCGTNANFAQLNRNIPGSDLIDYLTYSIHPQEHAYDNTTLTENLKAQTYTIESAREFSGGKPLWISPVNLMRRFNANIENYEHPYMGEGCPPQVDSRLMSLFGACWTTVSLKYLFESGVEGVTFFETVGERGIFQGDYPSRWPAYFQSAEGMIFPLFHVFSYVLKNHSLKVINICSSHPLKADCLLLSDGYSIKMLLVNFSPNQHKVIFDNFFKGHSLYMKQLNAETFADATTDIRWIENTHPTEVNTDEPLLLNPFSVSFIDGLVNT